ncbi:hypothetical protein BGZ76_010335 [Entomortierella beljakovae]|nr:hypothetical protein BGZ76_010335 [Entomortierella beljakovae]
MFRQETRKIRQKEKLNHGRITYNDTPYPTRLNFYLTPPPLEISIEEFEQFALDRMQVLTALNTFITAPAESSKNTSENLARNVEEAIKKYMPMHTSGGTSHGELMMERKKDHISHFILRLAYSRRYYMKTTRIACSKSKNSLDLPTKLITSVFDSQELRSWFLRVESALFKYRFEKESPDGQYEFLTVQNLSWDKVSEEEKATLIEKLKLSASSAFKQINVDQEGFFKVDFEKAIGLVGRRQIYLEGGKAYVPMSDQVVLALEQFKERLSTALEATARALPALEEDDRLAPVLNNINKQYLGREFTTSAIAGEIQAQDIENLKVHMPLCMENIHNELKREKHARHGSRMQYGLFLKGIGLSLDQALIFWQSAFEKLTPDQFNKQYSYNVRHLYGMEGKRTDYTPYSCRHIIQNNAPGTNDHHGCPFRHSSENNLLSTLTNHNLDEFDKMDVMGLVKGKHFQLACTKYYEVTRPTRDSAANQNGDIDYGSDSRIQELQPTIRGQYSYKKAGVQTPSQSNQNMEF